MKRLPYKLAQNDFEFILCELSGRLKKKKIIQVKQLANQSKTKLKDIGLLGYQISEIEVKLQLEGLDLKGNY